MISDLYTKDTGKTRRIFSGFLAISMVALYLAQLTACQSQVPETTTVPETTAAPGVTDQRVSTPLTLEQAEQQLKETGSTFVDTIEKASRLTGYPVTMPAFVPEGFAPWVIVNSGTFNIYTLRRSAVPGSPASQLPPFPYDVQQWFVQTQGRSIANKPFFMITQSRNKIQGVGGSEEPVDIGGHLGKKSVLPASDNNTARLGLSWSDGTMYYVMEGTLTGPLDEATLVKVASSMRIP
jgi:hypothetical protein